MASKRSVTIPKITQLPSGKYNCYLRIKNANGETQNISITDESYAAVEAKAKAIKAGVMEAAKQPRSLPTLGEAIDRYIAERSNVLSPSTIRGYEIIKRTRFQAYMGRNLSRLDERMCRTMVNAEASLCSAKTLKNAWRFVSSVIYNETGKRFTVMLPQEVKKPHAFLDFEQIKIFVKAIHGSPYEIAALMALHSLRASEIFAMDWTKIDLEKETMTISGAVVRGPDNKFVKKDTNKNRSSQRTVNILIPQLLSALNAADKSQSLITFAQSTFFENINLVCRDNGLPEVGIHGLRHSFASLAYHLGIPKEITMQIGGWKNDTVMEDIYTHLALADIDVHRAKFRAFYAEIADENADEFQKSAKSADF